MLPSADPHAQSPSSPGAPGRYEGSFFCERLIELAAKELAIDSVEMRRRNLVADAEMPYPLARVEPGDLYARRNATAAITLMRLSAVSPSSAGRKSASCKAV
jgi:CO/xanthine dehydrogenase Mo-binding subunit